jgi:hypothetical protein
MKKSFDTCVYARDYTNSYTPVGVFGCHNSKIKKSEVYPIFESEIQRKIAVLYQDKSLTLEKTEDIDIEREKIIKEKIKSCPSCEFHMKPEHYLK